MMLKILHFSMKLIETTISKVIMYTQINLLIMSYHTEHSLEECWAGEQNKYKL
jgi:hypothetical protein